MSPYPAQMEDHWWPRPGRRPGRELYQWNLLLHDQPEVHGAVAEVQQRLAGLSGLDLIGPQRLHVTAFIAGLADEVPAAGVRPVYEGVVFICRAVAKGSPRGPDDRRHRDNR